MTTLPSVSGRGQTKGGASLSYFIKRGDFVTRGKPDHVVFPGDNLRFTYSTSRHYDFAMFGVDGQGAYQYFPNTHKSHSLPPGRDAALDFSLELDDTLGHKRIVGLFCEAPFDAEVVRAELKTGRAKKRDCVTRKVQFEKRNRPIEHP